MAMYRLDKYLSLNGTGSRKEIKELVKKHKIQVNGETVKSSDLKIDTDKDIVEVDGQRVLLTQDVYYMLYKPAGVITANEDKIHRTVMDLLEDRRKDMFPVGRLDIDTEGLLLITNDGSTAHRLLSPKRHVDKTYYLETNLAIPDDAKTRIEKGLDLGDFTSLPAIWEQSGERCGYLTIHEGKFHQVKRMMEALGVTVTYLKRISMGPLKLDENLRKGEYRLLTQKEIEAITNI